MLSSSESSAALNVGVILQAKGVYAGVRVVMSA